MPKHFLFLTFSIFINFVFSQSIIANFSWDDPSKPATEADYGTNAISSSATAYVSAGGYDGTTGLNPGSSSDDIDLDFAYDPDFDTPGIDFSIKFQREEDKAWFISRSGFEFGMDNGQLEVEFHIEDGSGGNTKINSGAQWAVPNDDTWRTYRFFYLPEIGQAQIQVDGATVWTYSGFGNRDLHWKSADGFRIGHSADGDDANVPIFDNVSVTSVTNSALPVELIDFSLSMYNVEQVDLSWSTAAEINNDRFEVEKSYDAIHWEIIHVEPGAGNSQEIMDYTFTDDDASAPIQYYRLRQVDFDGTETVSAIISYQRDEKYDLKIFPNPTERYIFVEAEDIDFTIIRLLDMQGKSYHPIMESVSSNRLKIDLSDYPPGQYILSVGSVSNKIVLV